MTPLTIQCFDCKYFLGAVPTGELSPKQVIKYNCPAFPEKGVPEEIRSWKKPHTKIREDQTGKFVFLSLSKPRK